MSSPVWNRRRDRQRRRAALREATRVTGLTAAWMAAKGAPMDSTQFTYLLNVLAHAELQRRGVPVFSSEQLMRQRQRAFEAAMRGRQAELVDAWENAFRAALTAATDVTSGNSEVHWT